MKAREDYLIGVQFPNKRSPRDFNMTLIAMQEHAQDYHEEQLGQIEKMAMTDRDKIIEILESHLHITDIIFSTDFKKIANEIVAALESTEHKPTDEDIHSEKIRRCTTNTGYYSKSKGEWFERGAIWMREQIGKQKWI